MYQNLKSEMDDKKRKEYEEELKEILNEKNYE